jgi:demethylmenaquinone methyltransferase/2-methoxy-6-polyprenyl-1,4-benzoquinol methylase
MQRRQSKAVRNQESQWFGYEKTNARAKTEKVEAVFENVARNYDLMNDAMSAGLHRVWKNILLKKMRPRATDHLLDVAGGTGDIAFRFLKKAGGEAKVTVCDLTKAMLEVGQKRALDRGLTQNIAWVQGNAEKLPFHDHSFDLYSISFGLRNVTHIDDALAEAFRVLKPGGRFYCLEFSQVNNPFFSKLYDAYSFNIIPKMGDIIAGDYQSYQYLVESIRKFPNQTALSARLEEAGFAHVQYTNLMHGIAAIHTAYKL